MKIYLTKDEFNRFMPNLTKMIRHIYKDEKILYVGKSVMSGHPFLVQVINTTDLEEMHDD